MKNLVSQFTPFPLSVLRTPLLPFQKINKLVQEEAQLKKLFSPIAIQEAIYLASPVLHTEMLKWLQDEIKEPKESERVKISLLRYYLRMVGRATPFGLFAGCSVVPHSLWRGSGGEARNEAELSSQSSYIKHIRLDMDYLCALAQDIANIPNVKEQLLYFPNSSLKPLQGNI